MLRKFLHYALTFVITLFACILLLTIVNCIPKNAIEENVKSSATYLTENPGFPVIIDGLGTTRIDNYADTMLVNVIYNVDSSHPFKSLVSDKYYRIDNNEATNDLNSSVIDNKAPQNEYSRYWHGMQLFLRPLLVFFSLTTIRYILGAVLLALNIWLCVLLWKRGYREIMGVYIASLIIVDFWMSAFTIEYISIFLLVASLSIAMIYMKRNHMDILFIVGGALTCYFDFLTAETLTFTIPLMLYLLMRYKDGETHGVKESLKEIVKLGLCWLLSYAFMFTFKWLLVYIICGKASLIKALTAAAVRINGSVLEEDSTVTLGGFKLIEVLLLRNLGCLFHLRGAVSVSSVILASVIVFLVCFSYFYLFRKKRFDKDLVIVLLLIGLLPFIRFICLQNHSCMHYFFTYRALMAPVLAVLGVFYTSTDLLQFKKSKITNERQGK